jgi:hypothetical protein
LIKRYAVPARAEDFLGADRLGRLLLVPVKLRHPQELNLCQQEAKDNARMDCSTMGGGKHGS